MKATDIDLEQMLSYDPEAGKVHLGKERMLIFRQQAMSALRGLLFEQLGARLSRALLSQFGYQCGAGDYSNMMATYEWETDMDKLASGPILHTWEGIVRAAPSRIDYDRETGRFDMVGEWLNSYEAEIHLEQLGQSDEPVCYSLAGYASGWATNFFGRPVLCIERTCVGKGDDLCRFELRDDERFGPEADPWRQALALKDVSLARQLEDQLRLVDKQRTALERLLGQQEAQLLELSTPIMEVWEGILVLPLIGFIDERRSTRITAKLLQAIAEGKARCVILDITGVDLVDTWIATHMLQMVRAAGLLGAHCVVTGVNPKVAQTLVSLGVDLSSVSTLRNLKEGLRACMRFLNE